MEEDEKGHLEDDKVAVRRLGDLKQLVRDLRQDLLTLLLRPELQDAFHDAGGVVAQRHLIQGIRGDVHGDARRCPTQHTL